ncbi:XRE family transcriptional regulator, partial [Acinetobacter baumannii]
MIADHIKSLVPHIGKTHSELCHDLGWKKSRFSKVIAGKANLTLKTIFEISIATGYDFYLVFNSKYKRACAQP